MPATLTPAVLRARLEDPQLSPAERLSVLTELRENFEWLQSVDLLQFLEQLIPCFEQIILSLTKPQLEENPEQALRRAVLEVVSRLPHGEALRPHADRILRICQHVLDVDDAEPNAILALRIMFECHKAYRPHLAPAVPPFLDFVFRSYSAFEWRELEPTPTGHASVGHLDPEGETALDSDAAAASTNRATATPIRYPPASRSYKTVSECPLVFMYLSQIYTQWIDSRLDDLLPVMVRAVEIQVPPTSPARSLPIYHDFITAQMKTVSFISFLLRQFEPRMLQYAERVPRSVVNLLLNCPDGAVSIRKELLIASRHLLATGFRRGFFLQTDLLLDEKVLIGTGRAAYETLRPLAYSFLAELVHFVRLEVTLPQLSRIIYLFSTNVHDASLSFSMQATSIRLLLNLIEGIMHRREDLNGRGRQLLERIFETIVTKLIEVADVVPSILESATLEPSTRDPSSSKRAATATPSDGLDQANSKQSEAVSITATTIGDGRRAEDPVKELQECRQLVRTLVLGLKTIVWSMSNAFGDVRTRGLSEAECILISRMLPAARVCFQLYEHGDQADQREVLDQFAQVFTVMTPRNFQDIIGRRMPRLLSFMTEHNAALSIPQHFLANTSTSRHFADILITFLTEHLEEIVGEDIARASVLLRLFKIMFASVTLFADNEPVLKPHLGTIVRRCIQLAATTANPTNALQVLRALFKSLAGGRFDLLYREFVPLLYFLLHSLERLMQGPLGESHGLLLIELCLTAPARPSTIFPYLRMHMRPLVCGLESESELTSLSFRTLEFWIDTLHPEVLERLISGVQPELERALWRYLSPASPFSVQAVRILGKLGGLNRKSLRELTLLPWQQPVQAIHAALSWCDRDGPLPIALDELIQVASHAVMQQAPFKAAAYTLLQNVLLASITDQLPVDFGGHPIDLLPASVYAVSTALPRLEASKSIYTRILATMFFGSGDEDLQRQHDAAVFARRLCDYFCRLWMAPVLLGREHGTAANVASKGEIHNTTTTSDKVVDWTRFPAMLHLECFLDALVEASLQQQHPVMVAAVHELVLYALRRCMGLFYDARQTSETESPADEPEPMQTDESDVSPDKDQAAVSERLDPTADASSLTSAQEMNARALSSTPDDNRPRWKSMFQSCTVQQVSRLTEQLALLVERISHLGYRERWRDRLSCAMLLAGIIQELPVVVFLDRSYCLYEARLVRVLLQILKGCSQDGMASRKPAPLVRQTLVTLLQRCHDPAATLPTACDPVATATESEQTSQPTAAASARARCADVVACLVFDLASEHELVRETVHASVSQLLSYGICGSVAEVLALCHAQILRPLLARRIRTLTYSNQVGHLDCLIYCLEHGVIRPYIDQENSLLRTSLVAALEIFEDPINARLGEADPTLLNRLLENRFVDQETVSAIVTLRAKVLQFLTLCLRQIDPLVNSPNEDIRALYARLVACFFRGVESRHEVVTSAAKAGLRTFTERSRQLPRGILSSNLRPILQNLSDTSKLSIAYAQTLANVLEVLSNWFNIQLGERLLVHLRKLRDTDPHTPSLLAARIIDLFHLMPPTASRFLDRLVAVVLSLEDEMSPADIGVGHHGLASHWSGSMSPYRAPLLRYLEKHSSLANGYFLERVRFANYALLFQVLLRAPTAVNLRRDLEQDTARFLSATFERGHLLQGLLIIDALETFHPGWIATQRPVYAVALQIWQSGERLERLRREETLQVDQLQESNLLARIILAYCSVHHEELDGLFALLSIFALRTLRDFRFVRQFLCETVAKTYPIAYRKQIVERFLECYLDPAVSDEVKRYALLYLVIPVLRTAFRAGEGLVIMDSVTVEILVKRLFVCPENPTFGEPVGAIGTAATSLESDVLGEALLQLSTLLIEEMPSELVQYRRDIIRFGWNYLKKDDSIAKPWAFLNVARFFEAYQAPEKIVLQVFVALLRASQSEQRTLIREALGIITAILPSRLPATLGNTRHAPWIRFSKKILVEESYSALHLAHIWSLVIRHRELFFPGCASLLPHMVNSLPRLVSGTVAARENRRIALELAGLVIDWHRQLFQVEGAVSPPSNATSDGPVRASSSPDLPRRLEDIHAVADIVFQFLIRLPFLASEPREHSELFEGTRALLAKAHQTWNAVSGERPVIAQIACLDRLVDNLGTSPGNAGSNGAMATNALVANTYSASGATESTSATSAGPTNTAGTSTPVITATTASNRLASTVATPGGARDHAANRARDNLMRSKLLVLEHIVELCELFFDWQRAPWLVANVKSLGKLIRPVLIADSFALAYRMAGLVRAFWKSAADDADPAALADVRTELEQAILSCLDVNAEATTLHHMLLLVQTISPERLTAKHVELIVRALQRYLRECLSLEQSNRRTALIRAPEPRAETKPSTNAAPQTSPDMPRSNHESSGNAATSTDAETASALTSSVQGSTSSIKELRGTSAKTKDETEHLVGTATAIHDHEQALPLRGGFEHPGQANPLLVCLEILERLFDRLLEFRRPFLQMLWVLIDKCCYSEVLTHLLNVISQWILMDADDPAAKLQPKEKVQFLVKMTVFERIPGAQPQLEAFLSLVLRLFTQPCRALTREWLPRLERPFMIGLRASNSRLRNEFFQLFDESIVRNPVDRLYYIFEYQSWESLADSLWIRQATALLLALARVSGARLTLTPDCVRLGGIAYRVGDAAGPSVASTADSKAVDSLGDFGQRDRYRAEFQALWTSLQQQADPRAFLDALHELLHRDTTAVQVLWNQLFGATWSLLTDSDERVAMQDALIALLCRDYLLTQSKWRVNVVQIILDAATKCVPQVVIPPQLALHLATRWNAWHTVLTYLERRSRSSTLGVARHSDFVFDSLPDGQEFAGILDAKAELYRLLNESDLYIGLWKRRAMDSRTLLALSLEQQGHLTAAQDRYYDAMTNVESRVAVTEAEAALWEERWLHCAEELNQWDALTEFSRTVMHPVLLHEALWRLPDWAALKELVTKMPPEDSPRLKILQSFLQLQENRLDQVEPFISSGIRRALEDWQGLPETASISALEPTLILFQQFVELGESASVLQELNNCQQNPNHLETHAENIRMVLAMWRDRQANHWDSLSDWNRLISWRNHVLTAVVHTLQGLRNRSRADVPQPLLCMGINETAWNVNCYARTARKQRLPEVCLQALQRMYLYSTMDVQDFFMKTKEQTKAHLLPSSSDELALRAGLTQLRLTNREYFNTRQKSYLLALEGEFHHRLGAFEEANKAFAASIRGYGEHGGAWLRWARYCDDRQRPASAVHCYLQAIRFGSRRAREHLVSVFRIVFDLDQVQDSEQLPCTDEPKPAAPVPIAGKDTGSGSSKAASDVASSHSSAAMVASIDIESEPQQSSNDYREIRTEARDICESFLSMLPVWIWVPWSHELVSMLALGRHVKLLRHILLRLAGYYPEAVFFYLRTFAEERRSVDRPSRILCPRLDQIQLPVMHPLRSQLTSGMPPATTASAANQTTNAAASGNAAMQATPTVADADRTSSATPLPPKAGDGASTVSGGTIAVGANNSGQANETTTDAGPKTPVGNATQTTVGAASQARSTSTNALPNIEQNILNVLQMPPGSTPHENVDTVLAFMVKQHPQLYVELETIARELGMRMKPSAEEQVLHVLNALLHRCWSLPPLMHREMSAGMRSALEEVSKMCFGTGVAAEEFHVPPSLADLRESFEAELAPQTAKNFPTTIEPFVALLRKWRGIFRRRVQAMPETLRLERVSRKLVDIRDSQLHVFGQLVQVAQQDGEPLPELMVCIQSFSVDVRVVHSHGSSARGIAVTGTDGRCYRFLVETALSAPLQRSEDRVGHVCRFLNTLLQRDCEARRRRLEAHVPHAIPLGVQARLVTHQEHSVRVLHALQAFCECHGFDMDDTLVAFRDTCAMRLESLGNVASRELALEYRLDAFKQACQSLPESVLAQWAAASLPDANALFVLRKRFAQSLGASSLILYLLGVGSRSPLQLGICGSTGEAVHFDTHPILVNRGQQVMIGFDEAVPFRLTRNIRSLIRLTGVEGPFAGSMAATLNVICRHAELVRDLIRFVYTLELYERSPRETPSNHDLTQAVEQSLQSAWLRVEPIPFSAAPLVQTPAAPTMSTNAMHWSKSRDSTEGQAGATTTSGRAAADAVHHFRTSRLAGVSMRDEPEGVARRVAELIANAGDPAHLSQMEPLWYPWF
jgi:hypothetical protein